MLGSCAEHREEGLDKKNISHVDVTRVDEQLEILFLVLKITNNEYLPSPFESYANIDCF